MRKARFIPLELSDDAIPETRLCEQAGCEYAGEFRAPKNAHALRDYHWFCLDHVREYNKAWDFYRGMSLDEIEASRSSDVTWNRPSWPIGSWRSLLENAAYGDGIDPIFKSPPRTPALPKPVQKALTILELAFPLTMELLKKQYKELVKRYHPDLHPEDKLAEERLKAVNEAYQVVKKHLSSH